MNGRGFFVKKAVSVFLIVLFCILCTVSNAERRTVVKDKYYLGAMRVVKCKESVSLREAPSKTSKSLADVPLGAVVLYCSNNEREYAYSPYRKQVHNFIRCEYDGKEGYILKQYLEPAPEFEPVETRAENREMTWDEVVGNGELVLEWQELNISVLGAYEIVEEDGQPWEMLRIGCFIDEGDGPEPFWGYIESVQKTGEDVNLKAFMGGTEDEPQVMVYDKQYGLTMLDLMDGTEGWVLQTTTCPLGDAAVHTVGENTGILYIAGSDGPDPIAISSDGNVLWQAQIDDPEVYGPKDIKLDTYRIIVEYESGKTVCLGYDGKLISIDDTNSFMD